MSEDLAAMFNEDFQHYKRQMLMEMDLSQFVGKRVRHIHKNITGLYEGKCELTEREGYEPFCTIQLVDMDIGGVGWLAILSAKDIILG